eukprot:CAMPEP_0174275176 /NCGR_PEP_ID=MMETSP0439-20130205/59684_1 /TAXON_ID=0 /ORGANISM="Stereomyxa ramosa, Strain Chinc5" /LENGTH=172 /DNA_ID=CAMNT_0015367257 /DNA_START=762 /DNA_END=1278 /DNA_ORIENTATION=+
MVDYARQKWEEDRKKAEEAAKLINATKQKQKDQLEQQRSHEQSWKMVDYARQKWEEDRKKAEEAAKLINAQREKKLREMRLKYEESQELETKRQPPARPPLPSEKRKSLSSAPKRASYYKPNEPDQDKPSDVKNLDRDRDKKSKSNKERRRDHEQERSRDNRDRDQDRYRDN